MKNTAYFPAVLLGFAGALLLIAATFALPAGAEDNLARATSALSPTEYIVVLNDSAPDPDLVTSRIEKRLERVVSRTHTYRAVLKGFSAKLTPLEAEALRADADVAFVTLDQPVSIAIDRDAVRGNVEALRAVRAEAPRNSGQVAAAANTQTIPTGVNRIDAESLANKGAGVEVAVLDTGIDYAHPDLAANVIGGKNCSTGSSYKDGNGHGTHVAGTIAAVNNTAGVVGVAPAVKLWSVRVLNNSGSGTWSSIICGLDFVTSKAPANGGNIKIVNLSIGGAGTPDNNCGNTNNDAMHKAICRARDAGVTVVVAAGNNGGNTSATIPAGYDDSVITVSALADSNGAPNGGGSGTSYGADDTFATFSNYGTAVDVGAPGVNIYSTYPGKRYSTMSGTSMASPHVAGAAALYIATHPNALWTEVRGALVASAEALGAGHTDPSGKHPEPVLKVNTF